MAQSIVRASGSNFTSTMAAQRADASKGRAFGLAYFSVLFLV